MTTQEEEPIRIDSGSIINSISVEALIAARDALIEHIKATSLANLALVARFQEFGVKMPLLAFPFPGGEMRAITEIGTNEGAIEKEIDRLVWAALFARTGIDQIMDKASRDKMHQSLGRSGLYGAQDSLPPLTAENIRETIASLYERSGEFFDAAIEALFRRLSWDYKTNRPCRFSERMILGHQIDYWYTKGGSGFRIGFSNDAVDLERIVSIVLGVVQAGSSGVGLQARGEIPFNQWIDVASPDGTILFRAKGHRNGNLHVRDIPQKVVDKLNERIAARYPGQLQPAKMGEECRR